MRYALKVFTAFIYVLRTQGIRVAHKAIAALTAIHCVLQAASLLLELLLSNSRKN
jgi:hypothetical protein